jgi:hypothetical protein
VVRLRLCLATVPRKLTARLTSYELAFSRPVVPNCLEIAKPKVGTADVHSQLLRWEKNGALKQLGSIAIGTTVIPPSRRRMPVKQI